MSKKKLVVTRIIESCRDCAWYDEQIEVCNETGKDIIKGKIPRDCPLSDAEERER